MKNLLFIVVVCLLNGMFYSCTPEDIDESMARENVVLSTGDEDGQTPAGEDE